MTIGVATLLTALLASAGASIGLTVTDSEVQRTDEIGVLGAIALLGALIVAYYAGGYVAGRMSRFDGARQGMATWAIGLAVTVGLAVLGAILGDEYNVLGGLNLPSVPGRRPVVRLGRGDRRRGDRDRHGPGRHRGR